MNTGLVVGGVLKMTNEKVLVFKAELLDKLGKFQGVLENPKAKEYLNEILYYDNLLYIDRPAAEVDPNFKQLIPYCILRYAGKIFCYQRTKKGNENRLHDLYSLGVGGHINPEDGDSNGGNTLYYSAMQRELKEELGSLPAYDNKIVGLLYDDSNEVGQVHFGVVHRLTFDYVPVIKSTDAALTNGSFRDLIWVIANRDKFENWSKLVIERLL